jgi:hypothetical protein
MKTWKVVLTVELESLVEADSEREALLVAREGVTCIDDGSTVVDEHVTEWDSLEEEC